MIPKISQIEEKLLKLLNKSTKSSTKKIIQDLKLEFSLSDRDKSCLTACGRQKKFDNRVIYVRTKLIREGKIEMNKFKEVWIV